MESPATAAPWTPFRAAPRPASSSVGVAGVTSILAWSPFTKTAAPVGVGVGDVEDQQQAADCIARGGTPQMDEDGYYMGCTGDTADPVAQCFNDGGVWCGSFCAPADQGCPEEVPVGQPCGEELGGVKQGSLDENGLCIRSCPDNQYAAYSADGATVICKDADISVNFPDETPQQMANRTGFICPTPAESYDLEFTGEFWPPLRCVPVEGAKCYARMKYDSGTGSHERTFKGTFRGGDCVVDDCEKDGQAGKAIYLGGPPETNQFSTLDCATYLNPGDPCTGQNGYGHLNSDRQCTPGNVGDPCKAAGYEAGYLDANYDCIVPAEGGDEPPPEAPMSCADYYGNPNLTDYFDGTEWLCLECRNDEQLSPDGYCVCKDGLVRSNPNDHSSPCGKPTKPLTQQPPPEKGRTAGTDNPSPRTTGGKKEEKKGWGWGTWLAVGLGLGAAGLLIYGAAKGMGGKKPDELPPAPPPMRSNPVGEVDDETDAELMGELFMSVAGQRVIQEQQMHGYGDVQATLLPADSCRRGLCTNDGRPLEGAPDFTPHSVFFVDLEPGKAWPHAAAFVFIPQDDRPSAWLDASLPPLP